jgi:hypothetical protein
MIDFKQNLVYAGKLGALDKFVQGQEDARAGKLRQWPASRSLAYELGYAKEQNKRNNLRLLARVLEG